MNFTRTKTPFVWRAILDADRAMHLCLELESSISWAQQRHTNIDSPFATRRTYVVRDTTDEGHVHLVILLHDHREDKVTLFTGGHQLPMTCLIEDRAERNQHDEVEYIYVGGTLPRCLN